MAEKEDLRDIMAEETTRGRKRPRKAVSLREQRKLRRLFDMIRDANCEERDYLEVIRELGPKDGSPEFLYFVRLWKEYRGKSQLLRARRHESLRRAPLGLASQGILRQPQSLTGKIDVQ